MDEAYSVEYAIEEAVAEETVTAPGAGPARGAGRAIAGGTAWQALSQVVPLIINLAFTPVFIVGLGHERYGIFLIVSNITMLLAQFDGGLGQASMRFFTLYAGSDDRVAATRLLTSVSAVFAAGTLILFGGFVVATPTILGFFHVEPQYMAETVLLMRVLVVLVAFLMLRNLYNSLLFANGRFRITSIAIITSYLTYLAGMLATIHYDWGLRGVAATFVAQQIVGTLISVPAGVRYVDRRGVGWISRPVAKEFFDYAWRVQITGLIYVLTIQKDSLVAGRMISAQESGPYSQGSNFAQNLRMLPLNAFGPLQASIGQAVGAHGVQGARPSTVRMQRLWVKIVVGYGAVGLPATYFGVATWLRDSFGATAAPVATVLFLGAVFALMPAVLTVWCLSLGEPGLNLRYSLLSLGVNIVLTVLCWRAFGIMGVVGATAASQLIAALWLSWAARRRLSAPIEWFGRSIPWGWALLAAGVTLGLELLVHPWLPKGALGLLCCGLLAGPGFIGYLLAVFGPAQVRAGLRRLPVVGRFAG